MNKELKRFCCIWLCACLMSGMAFQPAGVFADTGVSDGKDMKVVITKTSSNYGDGYYVAYTINGIPYRTDTAGIRINQIAFKHMSDDDRKTTMMTYGFALQERVKQFGKTYSDDMAAWYREFSGLNEGQKILGDRLAEKNFPQFHERFKDEETSNKYFKENFEPDCEFRYFPELQKLYEEEQLVFSWAKAAYQAMVRAQLIQTSIAMKSLSGDLIQLIVDRALVPNITPAGAGGVASSINGIIGDYVGNIMGTTDMLQDMIIGKRVKAGEAREIIDALADTIIQNEKIIVSCRKRLLELKSEIERKYETLEKEYEKNVDDLMVAADAEANAVLEQCPIDGTPNAEIKIALAAYDARLAALASQSLSDDEYRTAREAIEKEKQDYEQQQYNSAMSDLQNWYMTYYGGQDQVYPKAGSIFGDIFVNYPEYPSLPYKILELNMTESEADEWEKKTKDNAGVMHDYYKALEESRQKYYQGAIAARNEYSAILSRVNALDTSDLQPYGEGEWYDLRITYVGVPEIKCDYTESCRSYIDDRDNSMSRTERYHLTKDYMHGTVVYSKAEMNYWENEYSDTIIEPELDKYKQYRADVADEIEELKDIRKEFNDKYQEYQDLFEKCSKLLDNAPGYVHEQAEGRSATLAGQFIGESRTGTADDVARIGAETKSLLENYRTLETQLELTAWDAKLTADTLAHKSGQIKSVLTESDPAYANGFKPWPAGDVELYFSKGYFDPQSQVREMLGEDRAAVVKALEELEHDFNGKTPAHERQMEIFEDLCDNRGAYSTARSDTYDRLKWEAFNLSENPAKDSYAAHVDPKPGEAANWPDPYEDMVSPMIDVIELARRANGVYVPLPEIIAINEDNLTVEGFEDKKTYTGDPLEQEVRVYVNDAELTPGTDYMLTYSDNKNVGTATMTIGGLGKYLGLVNKTFKIVPKKSRISRLTATKKGFKAVWSKVSSQATGYELQIATDSKFKKNKKTYTIKSYKTKSKTVSKLKAKQKYYVRIRTYKNVKENGKTVRYYSSWSGAKTVKTRK